MIRVFAAGLAGVLVGALLCYLLVGRNGGVPTKDAAPTLAARVAELTQQLATGTPLTATDRAYIADQSRRIEELAGQVSLHADQMERLAVAVGRDKVYVEELVQKAQGLFTQSAAVSQQAEGAATKAERAFEKGLAK